MAQYFFAILLVTCSIFVHELGHFVVARWRKLYVPRFSIFGIGKPILSWKWRGVEYCICMLPIGAYVMVPQLADLGDFEGELPADAPSPLPPADYRSKVLVAVAGPLANILFALVLACVVWVVGVQIPLKFNNTEIGYVEPEMKNSAGKTVPGPAAAAGLQRGDIIRQIDGNPVSNYQEVLEAVVFGAQVAPDGRRVANITFERDGVTMTRQVFPELIGRDGLRTIGVEAYSDLIVEKVRDDSPAAKAGLQSGDRFISVDGRQLTRTGELIEHFQKKNAEPSTLVFRRGETLITTTLQPRLETIEGQTLYRVGINWRNEMVVVHPTPLTQIKDAGRQIYRTFTSVVNRRSDIGVRHMSGFFGMIEGLQQAATAGIGPMLGLLLAINLSLAVFNLLPIPVLDGGHIAIATLTRLRGRPPNPILMQKTVAACFVMLVGLIAYVTFHDIRRTVLDHMDFNPPSATPAKPTEKNAHPPGNPAPAPAK